MRPSGTIGTSRKDREQYEIRWAQLPDPVGRRRVLLLTRSPAYGYLNKAIVAEVTTTIRGIPQEVSLQVELGRACVANMDNVHVVSLGRLGPLAGRVSESRQVEVKRAIGHALGWPELMAL